MCAKPTKPTMKSPSRPARARCMSAEAPVVASVVVVMVCPLALHPRAVGVSPRRRQVSWLAGRRPCDLPSRNRRVPVASVGLAAYSCGGSRGVAGCPTHRVPSLPLAGTIDGAILTELRGAAIRIRLGGWSRTPVWRRSLTPSRSRAYGSGDGSRKGRRGNAVSREAGNAAAVPATVGGSPRPGATGAIREGGRGRDPRARRPAVA